jgi:hypothetical protein
MSRCLSYSASRSISGRLRPQTLRPNQGDYTQNSGGFGITHPCLGTAIPLNAAGRRAAHASSYGFAMTIAPQRVAPTGDVSASKPCRYPLANGNSGLTPWPGKNYRKTYHCKGYITPGQKELPSPAMIPWLFDHGHGQIQAVTRHARIGAQLPPRYTCNIPPATVSVRWDRPVTHAPLHKPSAHKHCRPESGCLRRRSARRPR